jgi:phosphoketolase
MEAKVAQAKQAFIQRCDHLVAKKEALKQQREKIATEIETRMDKKADLEAQLTQETNELADLEIRQDECDENSKQVDEEMKV